MLVDDELATSKTLEAIFRRQALVRELFLASGILD